MGANGRKWAAEEELQILDEARNAGQLVSEVCRRHRIALTQFYESEKQARAGALEARRTNKRGRKPTKTVAYLKDEVVRLRIVVAELSAETLQLKKDDM
jgi:transposase-like protein